MADYFNEILDLYERQAKRELAELQRGSIQPSTQSLINLQRRHIEWCEPVYAEMVRAFERRIAEAFVLPSEFIYTREYIDQGLREIESATKRHQGHE